MMLVPCIVSISRIGGQSTEYPTFEGWIWDMLRSGVLEKGGSIK